MPRVYWFGKEVLEARERALRAAERTEERALTVLGRKQAELGLRYRLWRIRKTHPLGPRNR